jgi:hypothetical protein
LEKFLDSRLRGNDKLLFPFQLLLIILNFVKNNRLPVIIGLTDVKKIVMPKITLNKICHGRSGDKGDAANIGLIAYKTEDYNIIKEKVTAPVVKKYFEGICLGEVERYEMPNINALNFVLHNTLGGGGTVSLKNDAQGKTLASALLMMEIEV